MMSTREQRRRILEAGKKVARIQWRRHHGGWRRVDFQRQTANRSYIRNEERWVSVGLSSPGAAKHFSPEPSTWARETHPLACSVCLGFVLEIHPPGHHSPDQHPSPAFIQD